MKTINFIALVMLIGLIAETFACFPECHPDYAEWVAAGQPACWCYPRQCKGDADGLRQGNFQMGYWWVGELDLDILISTWAIKEPPYGPGLGGQVCADFDHRAAGSIYTGWYRINPQDICILSKYYLVLEPPDGPGVWSTCLDCEGDPQGEMEGPNLSIWTDPDGASGFGEYNEITVPIGQLSLIGILNSTSDNSRWYDGYLIITQGLENGSWTGSSWVYEEYVPVPGWTYYGTTPIPTQDAWFVQVSAANRWGSLDPGMVSAWLEYVHEGPGDTTISLYNEYYELVDTLVIHGPGQGPEDIHLLSPNGGERLVAGSAYPIEWTSTGAIEDVEIEFSNSGGLDWQTIIASTGNNGVYLWDPVADANSPDCRIRIRDVLSDVNDVSDDVFTIFNCLIGPIPGDLNEDCYVNLADLAILSEHWQVCGNPFDSQCIVNLDKEF